MKEFLTVHHKESFQEWEGLFCFLHSPKVQMESRQTNKKRLVQIFERKRFYKVALEECRKENVSMKESIERMSAVISQISEENRLSNEQLYSYKAIEEDDSVLRNEIEAMQTENKRQQEINDELRNVVNRLQDENRSYVDRLERLQTLCDETTQRAEQSEMLLDECKTEKDIILVDKESLQDQLNALNSESSSLKSQVLSSQDKYKELEEESQKLQSLLHNLEIEKSRDSQRILELENLCSISTSEKEKKDIDIADLHMKIAQAETRWSEQENHLQGDISQLKDVLQHREDELQSANERASKVQVSVEHVITQVTSMLSPGIVPSSQQSDCSEDEAYGWDEAVKTLNKSALQCLKEKEELLTRFNDTETQLKSLDIENRELTANLHGQVESLKKALEEKEAELNECRGRMVEQEDSHNIALGNLDAQLVQCQEEAERLRVDIVTRQAEVVDLGRKLSEHDCIADERLIRLEAEYNMKINELRSLQRSEHSPSHSKGLVEDGDEEGVIVTALKPESAETPSSEPTLSLKILAHTIVDDYVNEALGHLP
jgi:chromosome segregation ATPase